MTKAADEVYGKSERLLIGVSFSVPSELFVNALGPRSGRYMYPPVLAHNSVLVVES
jgi:hypothetical protein